jgi:hypothetical protein
MITLQTVRMPVRFRPGPPTTTTELEIRQARGAQLLAGLDALDLSRVH